MTDGCAHTSRHALWQNFGAGYHTRTKSSPNSAISPRSQEATDMASPSAPSAARRASSLEPMSAHSGSQQAPQVPPPSPPTPATATSVASSAARASLGHRGYVHAPCVEVCMRRRMSLHPSARNAPGWPRSPSLKTILDANWTHAPAAASAARGRANGVDAPNPLSPPGTAEATRSLPAAPSAPLANRDLILMLRLKVPRVCHDSRGALSGHTAAGA